MAREENIMSIVNAIALFSQVIIAAIPIGVGCWLVQLVVDLFVGMAFKGRIKIG